MNNGNTIAARAMLDRILKLCGSGLSPEQIAIDILDADQETALFRVRMLVDIIIDYARRSDMENSSMAAHCHASGEILAVVPQGARRLIE